MPDRDNLLRFISEKKAEGFDPEAPAPLAEDREIWEQQPRESVQAYRRFQKYLSTVGPSGSRSMKAVAASEGVSVPVIKRLSGRWSWVRRVTEYDKHLAVELETRRLRDIDKMSERHTEAALQFQEMMMSMLNNISGRIRDGQLDSLTTDEILDFMLKAIRDWPNIAKMERLSRGEPESIAKIDIEPRIRERAIQMGIDPEEAVKKARKLLGA